MKEIINISIKDLCDYVCCEYPESVGIVYWILDNDLVMLRGVSVKGEPAGKAVICDASGKVADEERFREAMKYIENFLLAVDKGTEQGICFLDKKVPNDWIKNSIIREVFGTDCDLVVGEQEGFSRWKVTMV